MLQGEKTVNEEQACVEKLLTEPDYDDEGFVDYIYDGHTYKLWYGRMGSGSEPPRWFCTEIRETITIIS